MKNGMKWTLLLVGVALMLSAHSSVAERFSLNYDRLSAIEGPIALEIGDITFTLSGSIDLESLTRTNDDDTMNNLYGTVELSFNTQLPNRWRVQGLVLGEASTASNPRRFIDDFDYVKRLALFVSGTWGRFLMGDLHSLIRGDTRRISNAGDSFLYFDDFLGKLEQRNGGYRGRYGPWIVSAVFDQDSDFECGIVSQRPIGNKDFRFSLRTMKGTYEPPTKAGIFAKQGVLSVGEMIYGSTIFDVSLGYEELVPITPQLGGASVQTRTFMSQGVLTKRGMVSASFETYFGELGGERELSASIGVQYDLARGMSANFGWNYWNTHSPYRSVESSNNRDTEITFSLQYDF